VTRRLLLAPSILSADHARLGEEIHEVEEAGADWIHVDVMDGHFVPNLTLGPPIIASLRRTTKLPFDVHLMIEAPDRSLQAYVDAGANRVTVQAEACVHLHRTLTQIREAGAKAGVALNPATPLSAVTEVLDLADLVLVMTVNPGFSGQKFIAEVMPKLRALRALVDARPLPIDIQVDGGVDAHTAGIVAAHGANILVSGSAVFGSKSYKKTLAAMRKSASVAELLPAPLRSTQR
jgi:ribulose-phosphate 3-epimerase